MLGVRGKRTLQRRPSMVKYGYSRSPDVSHSSVSYSPDCSFLRTIVVLVVMFAYSLLSMVMGVALPFMGIR